ncbi:MAG: isochorismatase family protein [Deltaproteobacteria bacterium]|nr:isochorismatase family protein [Deltaproteobacteria bacterium]
MGLNDIELKKTVILYFDTLKGYWYNPEGSIKPAIKPQVDNAIRLMKGGREAHIPIFFAKGNHRPDGASSATILTDTTMSLQPWPNGIVTKGKPGIMAGHSSSEIPAELDPQPEDYYIPKYRWSAFYQTCLDLSLRARGADTLIIAGGSTEVGVASTVYSGRDADYNMIIVRDACTTSHDQRALDALMDLVFPRMARVRTTDQVLQMIRQAQ